MTTKTRLTSLCLFWAEFIDCRMSLLDIYNFLIYGRHRTKDRCFYEKSTTVTQVEWTGTGVDEVSYTNTRLYGESGKPLVHILHKLGFLVTVAKVQVGPMYIISTGFPTFTENNDERKVTFTTSWIFPRGMYTTLF